MAMAAARTARPVDDAGTSGRTTGAVRKFRTAFQSVATGSPRNEERRSRLARRDSPLVVDERGEHLDLLFAQRHVRHALSVARRLDRRIRQKSLQIVRLESSAAEIRTKVTHFTGNTDGAVRVTGDATHGREHPPPAL